MAEQNKHQQLEKNTTKQNQKTPASLSPPTNFQWLVC